MLSSVTIKYFFGSTWVSCPRIQYISNLIFVFKACNTELTLPHEEKINLDKSFPKPPSIIVVHKLDTRCSVCGSHNGRYEDLYCDAYDHCYATAR
jgi:hypothetical protein